VERVRCACALRLQYPEHLLILFSRLRAGAPALPIELAQMFARLNGSLAKSGWFEIVFPKASLLE
jgi:hypothetical protein